MKTEKMEMALSNDLHFPRVNRLLLIYAPLRDDILEAKGSTYKGFPFLSTTVNSSPVYLARVNSKCVRACVS